MKSLFKFCLPVLATALLASCGGGGGDGHGAFTPAGSGKIELSAETLDLPLNSLAALPDPGGPFTSQVTVTVRHRDGSLATEIDTVNVSINPQSVATFSTLDDPDTEDINEILERWGQAPVDVVAGKATIFVTSSRSSGQATLTVTTPRAGSDGLNFKDASLVFTVGNVAAPTPRDVAVTADHRNVYLSTSGGRSTSLLTALLTDAGGQLVPDAGANVQFEVLGGSAKGTLSGGSSNGEKIQVGTTRGVAHASFRAGSTLGPVTVRVTADGADNNVANGIADPVTAEIDLVVSDGKPFSVTLVSPEVNAIWVNSISGGLSAPVGDDGEVIIPADLDGTYGLTVSALVTDRQGNPALPGLTEVQFGAIDAPLWGFPEAGPGFFKLSGIRGNPREGGNLFTALDGQFTIIPGDGPQDRVGPGDTLLVYGKAVAGNSDLESARKVAQVTGATSLLINSATPFNLNDTTGSSVDFGAVLPWAIGRAQSAAITNSATVNEIGVATVRLNYPINQLGKHVAIFAQVNAGTANDPSKIATDIGDIRFPGVAPARIVAYPDPIPGNGSLYETVCVYDALDAPIAGLPVAFGFHGLGAAGRGWLDGQQGAGFMDEFTGLDGCATGLLRTVGIGEDSDDAAVRFNAAGAAVDVPITAGGSLILMARPSALGGYGGRVTLTLLDGSGNPVPGVQIGGTCTASGAGVVVAITSGPGVTDENGETQALINASGLNGYGEANEADCEFNTAGGPPTATVHLAGMDLCTLDYSPAPPPDRCSDTGGGNGMLNLSIIRGSGATNTAAISVSTNPANITCSMASTDTNISCPVGSFAHGSTVIATGSVNSGGPVTLSWIGDCTNTSSGSATVTVDKDHPKACTLVVAD